MTTPLRRVFTRILGVAAFAGALSGLGVIVIADASAGEVPVEGKAPVAAAKTDPPVSAEVAKPATKPEKVAAPAQKRKPKAKRVDFGRYEGY